MKCVSIQLYPQRDQSHNLSDLLALVRSVGRYPEVDADEGDDQSVNLNFFTEDVQRCWSDIENGVLNNSELGDWVRNNSIIVCEGDQGWDDYLVLWHFDETQRKPV